MREPERIFEFGRWHPGPHSRVEGVAESVSLGGRRGVILKRHPTNYAMVRVKWDDSLHEEYVVIGLLRDEPVLDQMARIMEDQDGKR